LLKKEQKEIFLSKDLLRKLFIPKKPSKSSYFIRKILKWVPTLKDVGGQEKTPPRRSGAGWKPHPRIKKV